MKLHDTLVGVLLIALGAYVLVVSSGFPRMPGQIIGPGTMPTVLGVALLLGGASIGVSGWRRAPLIVLHEGWRRRDRQIAALVAVGGVGFLAYGFETLGFPLGGFLLLAAIFLAAGMWHPGWLLLSATFVLVVHLGMTRLLYVPLPAGLLDGVL